VLGHCSVDTPHIHTFEGDSILSKLFALHRHSHAEWLKYVNRSTSLRRARIKSIEADNYDSLLLVFVRTRRPPYEIIAEGIDEGGTSHWVLLFEMYWLAGVGGRGCGRRDTSGGNCYWCCFYYFVRNSLVTLPEALCARILFFTFVNIGFSWHFFFVCKAFVSVKSLSSGPLNQIPVPACRHTCCVLLVCVCLYMCMWKCVDKVTNI